MSLQAVTVGCQIVRALCTSADVVNDVAKMCDQADTLRGASIVTRSALLAINLFELIGTACGKIDTSRGHSLKQAELVVRLLDMPISCSKEIANLESARTDSETIAGFIRIFETGIINPMFGMIRTVTEREIYREKQYLEMNDKQLADQQRPVYSVDSEGGLIITGYKPVTREECQEIIKAHEASLPFLLKAEMVTQLAPAETFYRCLAACLINQQPPAAPAQQQPPAPPGGPQGGGVVVQANHAPIPPNGGNAGAAAPAAQQAPDQLPPGANDDFVQMDNLFKLTLLKSIPTLLEEDKVFKKFTCCITQEAIRDPVGDPTAQGLTLYERKAIVVWLRRNGTSPVTRERLLVAQLVERPDIKTLIDSRLAYHESELRKVIQANLSKPTPAIQAAAASVPAAPAEAPAAADQVPVAADSSPAAVTEQRS